MNRRQLLAGVGMAFVQSVMLPETASAKDAPLESKNVLYGRRTLPVGIRSKRVVTDTGATLHVLEAGYESRTAPCVVLLHGFPSWATAGGISYCLWHKRAFTSLLGSARLQADVTQPVQYSDDLLPYSMLNRVSDVVGLVRAFGHDTAGRWSVTTGAGRLRNGVRGCGRTFSACRVR